ncbi:MAG: NAD(+)--dinitrogen-reductase ADP-D-ribosyltransferase, partial [Deltaproteobacteria bacterium]|nr:NAD(+)--dinitrogen-reductase ADP-D-ribosyltransferase [Deltaproteobacteria bacterium]
EFARQTPTQTHLRLFRGVNRLDAFEELDYRGPRDASDRRGVVLLNNINSFSRNRERAGEFGDYILTANVPVAKVIFHSALLPGVLQGEDEMLVVGGAYEVTWTTF